MTGRAETGGKERGNRACGLEDVVRGWPRDRGLAVVCGGGPAWGWTLVGEPVRRVRPRTMEEVRAVLREGRPRQAVTGATTWGGWVVALSYELGEVIEPAVRRKRSGRGDWPLIELQRCEEAFVFDHERGEWDRPVGGESRARSFSIGELASEMGREAYEAAVERAIEYIRAGDVYQVNLAHRMSGAFSGSTREAFARLVEGARPWHGAYVESGHAGGTPIPPIPGGDRDQAWALVSASPELFLRVDGPRVMTRPMKGTRAGNIDASELRESGKDRAELNMIIDLMRNDLGRVCRFGTVRVEEERAIEKHGSGDREMGRSGVWQGVGTVVGELREGMDLVDLLAAAFPAGSVTGAPKIRAMQIIDELETCERGPYCGSIGWIGDDGRACLNVAIRTACVRGRAGESPGTIEDGEISYSVGAGIVAESKPRREWEETMEKAGVLLGLRR